MDSLTVQCDMEPKDSVTLTEGYNTLFVDTTMGSSSNTIALNRKAVKKLRKRMKRWLEENPA